MTHFKPQRHPDPAALRRVPLPLLFAILGAVGGWTTGEVFAPLIPHVGLGDVRLVLLLSTCVLGMAVGVALRDLAANAAWWAWTFAAVFIAAGVNCLMIGALILVPEFHCDCPIGGHLDPERWRYYSISAAVTTGVLLAATLLVLWSARQIGWVRPGSHLTAARLRGPWRMLAVLCAGAAVCDRSASAWLMICGSLLIALACLALDLRAALQLRGMLTRPLTPLSEVEPATVDLGVGDELHVQLQTSGGPFRTTKVPVFVLRGRPQQAVAALRHAVLFDGIALMAMLAMAVIRR